MKLTHVDDKAGYTTEERVRRAVAVSRERLASTQQQRRAFGDVSAPVHLATRQYIVEYLIGDPPQRGGPNRHRQQPHLDAVREDEPQGVRQAGPALLQPVAFGELRAGAVHGQHEAVRSQRRAPLQPGRQLHVHR
jgi:hypothetical protein